MSVLQPAGRAARGDVPTGIATMVVLTAVVVLLHVSLMPYIRLLDGIPDLIAAYVVAVALMRGPTVGAIVGFLSGFMVELTSPIGTLGVYAIIYMAIGAYCGRYCGRPEAQGLLAPIGLIVACSGAALIGYFGMHLLLGAPLGLPGFLGRVLLPQMALTALIAPAVLLVVRRLLKKPFVLEPGYAT